ncbi:MAG: flagellar motor switch protein FliG [bacterium]|jgi:flagellar motor switch protein FliG
MKQKIFLLCILGLLSFSFHTFGQERIHSVSLKEHEIEQSIREALTHYLQSKDYVVKVKIRGKKVTEKTKGKTLERIKSKKLEGLPGFESESERIKPTSITDIIGETYWTIRKMRVDLVVHKEISSSVYNYINKMVPIIAGINRSRGDIFKFDPILPNKKLAKVEKKQKDKQKTIVTKDGKIIQDPALLEKKWYDFSKREWIILIILLICLALVLFFLVRIRHMNHVLYNMQQELIHSENKEETAEQAKDEALAKITEERERLRAQQETQVRNALQQDENQKITHEIIAQLVGRPDWSKELVEEYTKDKGSKDKLASLFFIFGAKSARQLFSNTLGTKSCIEIENLAQNIQEPTLEQQNILLKELRSFLFAKKLENPEQSEVDPFLFLKSLTANQVAFLVEDEPIRTKAIAISRLRSEHATEIFQKLKKQERAKILLEIGKLNEIPLDLIERTAYDLASKTIPDDTVVAFDGVNMLVDMMSDANAEMRQEIMNNLRVSDQVLSKQVESRLFLFDSIPLVPKDILIEVVRTLPKEDVIPALVGSSTDLKRAVILCYPAKTQQMMASYLKTQKPSADEVKDKQKIFANKMRQLADDGKVDLRKIITQWEKKKAS